MKKFAIYMFAVLAVAGVNASYNGNPAAPELTPGAGLWWSDTCSDWSIKLGYQRDDVTDRKLSHKHGFVGRNDRFEIHQDQGVVTLNWCDKYEVFGSLGAASFELNESPFHYSTHDRLLWGIGARAILWQCDCTTLGAEFNYEQTDPDHRHRGDVSSSTFAGRWKYQEWQGGIGVAQKIGFFTPYAAVKFSYARVKLHDSEAESHFSLKSRRYVGLALGATLSNCDWFDLTLEARVFDERACTFAANIKF